MEHAQGTILEFDCPLCGGPLSAYAEDAHTQARCTHCRQPITVPGASTPAPAAASEKAKTFEDFAADAICAGAKGAWKFSWSFAKVTVPVAGRITGKVIGRAATAAAATPLGKKLAAPAPPPSKPMQIAKLAYLFLRLFGG
jgi:hypothetical protein